MTELCIIEAKTVETTQKTQYIAPNAGVADKRTQRVRLTKFSFAGAGTIAINIVVKGGTAGAGNLVLPARAIVITDEPYTCPGLVGQILEPGDFLSTIATGTVVMRACAELLPPT